MSLLGQLINPGSFLLPSSYVFAEFRLFETLFIFLSSFPFRQLLDSADRRSGLSPALRLVGSIGRTHAVEGFHSRRSWAGSACWLLLISFCQEDLQTQRLSQVNSFCFFKPFFGIYCTLYAFRSWKVD